VGHLRFSPREYRAICEVCLPLSLGRRPPRSLKRHLTRSLADADPDLAGRVAGLSRQQVEILHEPLSERSLVATISLSVYHFEILAAVCRELAELRNCLESRKIVDRAKGVLMSRAGMSEAQAHARLQALASSRGMKVAAVADLVVEAELAFSKTIT
jgi:two-component system, response regulator PdtaR